MSLATFANEKDQQVMLVFHFIASQSPICWSQQWDSNPRPAVYEILD
jgi:hypothetical protein